MSLYFFKSEFSFVIFFQHKAPDHSDCAGCINSFLFSLKNQAHAYFASSVGNAGNKSGSRNTIDPPSFRYLDTRSIASR